MSIVYLLKECREVRTRLLTNPDSFIVQYTEPRPNNASAWFYVSNPKSMLSQIISDDVGEHLVRANWIAPELSNEEYQIQLALGLVDYRVYNITSSYKYKTVRTFYKGTQC